jgi:hypothetical protein
MRKILVIALVGIHLIGNTEVGQLLKLPQLLSHYFQHHRQDPGISFVEFISMHYWGDDGTSADDDFDNKLPCHNAAHNTIPLVYSPMTPNIMPEGLTQRNTIEHNSCLEAGISSKHVLLILQPPRTA